MYVYIYYEKNQNDKIQTDVFEGAELLFEHINISFKNINKY